MSELDDLESIENSGQSQMDIDLSNIYSVKQGGFGDQSKLKTYIGSIKVRDLKEDLDLYETLTKDKSWPVSQIIQREVDKIRVSDIAKSYIQGQGRVVKYFPPLVVAILPKESDGKISMTLNFDSEITEDVRQLIYDRSNYSTNEPIKKYILEASNLSIMNGVHVLEVSKVFDMKLLSWDKNKYYAIVIDGQHRYKALLKSAESKTEFDQYLQDIVFVDFSPLINSKPEFSPVEVVRRIFVDINTNARKVGFVRRILMDDKEISALCVQSLVDSVARDGANKSQEQFLYSQVVDWYGEKLKHSLPHLTGVLSLYQIIDDYLIRENLSSLNDLRSPKKVSKWISRLNNVFMIDRIIENADLDAIKDIKTLHVSWEEYDARRLGNEEYSEDIEDEYKESEIFSYDYRILDIARSQFDSIYLEPIIKFFNEFRPLKKGIDLIREKGGFGDDNTLSTALISSRTKVGNTKVLRDSISELKLRLEQELHPKYFLILTVLGQKAVFNNLFKRIEMELNPDMNKETCSSVVEIYLKDINSLIEYFEQKDISLFANKDHVTIDNVPAQIENLGNISNLFWEGVNYDNNSIIYNSQGIATLSYLISEFIRLNNCRLKGEAIDFDINEAPWVRSRIKRIIKKTFDYQDEQLEEYAQEIIDLKSEFIQQYFSVDE